MFDVSSVVAAICEPRPKDPAFEPTDVQLSDSVLPSDKIDDELPGSIAFDSQAQPPASFEPQFPLQYRVVAIDSTSVVLGYVREGLVGAIRASVIIKPAGTTHHQLKHYGPYLAVVTNYNKDEVYKTVTELVYGKASTASAPDPRKTLDRLRNLLERQLQLQAVNSLHDTLVLVDGSLMAGAVADPMFVIKGLLHNARLNHNTVVALSKFTSLTLRENQLSILSLIDGVPGTCYIGDLREHLTQKKDRYMGCIYVGRLTPHGETFRFDIPDDAPLQHEAIFSMVSGLSGEHGYPEELKLAHMTSVLSAIEVIELQAAAINLHGLEMKENVRRKLFPM